MLSGEVGAAPMTRVVGTSSIRFALLIFRRGYRVCLLAETGTKTPLDLSDSTLDGRL